MRGYLFLAPLLLLATPASAQFWGGPSGGVSRGRPVTLQPSTVSPWIGETDRIRRDIRDGRESGQLSRREARQLRRESFRSTGCNRASARTGSARRRRRN